MHRGGKSPGQFLAAYSTTEVKLVIGLSSSPTALVGLWLMSMVQAMTSMITTWNQKRIVVAASTDLGRLAMAGLECSIEISIPSSKTVPEDVKPTPMVAAHLVRSF